MRLLPAHLQGLGTTIFAEMSALATATGSINLGQGFPDTDGPEEVREAAVRALREGRGNQYPPGIGIPPLREAIARHQQRWYGLQVDPDREVLVTAGATEALAAAILALVDEGDEVIALEPFYDSYAACIAMARGVRVPVTLRAPDFRVDAQALRAALTPRTRMLLINAPHNPTGMVLTDAERAAIRDVAVEHDLVVVADEVYEHLVFDGVAHVPLASLPGMAERTITIGSAGKTFSFTGWKIGWAVAPAPLIDAVRTTKQFLTYVSGGPFQYAVAEGLDLPDDYFAAFTADLQHKRDVLSDGLRSVGFDVMPSAGTYFVTTDIRPLGFDDGLAFCRSLPERAGVVAIPHQVFYDDVETGRPLVRWAFCKQVPVLEAALDRLSSGLRSPG
jgi:N-succinyldiaminopimelate aminotransferase